MRASINAKREAGEPLNPTERLYDTVFGYAPMPQGPPKLPGGELLLFPTVDDLDSPADDAAEVVGAEVTHLDDRRQ